MTDEKTEIQRLYEGIPTSYCLEGCFECCRNMVQFAPEELERMGGYSWDGVCIHLKEGRCSVYEVRPLVCRLFGVSELMKCDDCHPQSYLSADETGRRVAVYSKIMKQQTEHK